MAKKSSMTLETIAIDELQAHPRNYRGHPQEQIAHLKASLAEYGIVKNIVVASDNVILAGHGLVQAAREAGYTELPVCRIAMPSTDPKAQKFMVLDNEVSRKSEDDNDQLAALLKELQDSQDLTGTGYDSDEVTQLLNDLQAEEFGATLNEDAGPEEPPIEPVTRLGDIWVMGEHRLVCGDCTEVGAVDAVTCGKRFTAILTDPPYQMGKDIAGDSLGDADFSQLHKDFISILPADDICTFVSFHSSRTFPVVLDAAREAGWKFERMLWMYKNNDCTFPWRGWLLTSEAILIFTRNKGNWNDAKPFSHDCYVYNHTKDNLSILDGSGWHPSVKPISVVADIMSRISDKYIFDPFVGSGTSFAAAEQTGRICYGIELEPRYVDVAVKRWQKLTGKQAILESTGEAFSGE